MSKIAINISCGLMSMHQNAIVLFYYIQKCFCFCCHLVCTFCVLSDVHKVFLRFVSAIATIQHIFIVIHSFRILRQKDVVFWKYGYDSNNPSYALAIRGSQILHFLNVYNSFIATTNNFNMREHKTE